MRQYAAIFLVKKSQPLFALDIMRTQTLHNCLSQTDEASFLLVVKIQCATFSFFLIFITVKAERLAHELM